MASYVFTDEKLWCVFEDRLDANSCLMIEKELLSKVKEHKSPVVFDLGGVSYIASAFLRICFLVSKLAGKGNLTLVNASPDVKRILKIAGLDKHIKIK